MEWPPLHDNIIVVKEYTSLLDACRNVLTRGKRAIILVKDVDELVKIEEIPSECIMLIKPDNDTVYKGG